MVLGVCSAIGLIVWGRSTRQEEIDTIQGMLDIANAAIKQERARMRARLEGAAIDFERAGDLERAVASGDIERVRDGFADDGTDAASAEPGGAPDSAGG